MGRTEINHAAIAALPRSPEVRRIVLDAARGPVQRARTAAPKRTGAGAASIHAETVLTPRGWEARIGWDRLHAYMRFPNFGTDRGVEARHFLERALGVDLRKGR